MANTKLGSDIYYTFRVISEEPLLVECIKWDEFQDTPLDTYRVRPNDHSLSGCSCPAWKRECKHFKCVQTLIANNQLADAHCWRWNPKTEWERNEDF